MSRLFRFIRNAAVLAGVVRGLRKERSTDADGITDAERARRRAVLEALGSSPTALLRFVVPFSFVLAATVRLLPPTLILAAYLAGRGWAPASAGSDFFSAAAQVIPVLLLALAVESRLLRFGALIDFRPRPFLAPEIWAVILEFASEKTRERLRVLRALDTGFGWMRALQSAVTAVIVAAGIVVALSLAEWDCLNILATIGADRRDPEEVSAGILAGLVGVGLIATIGRGVEAKALARLEDRFWARLSRPLRDQLLTAMHGPSRDVSA